MTGFDIGHKHVGDGAPCLIVAEVAQAHEGSLSLAHAYIDAIADAGADAVKFQCHIAEAESTPDEPWRVEPRWPQDNSRFDYWKRMEFTRDQWWSLQAHAEQRGLIFLCSPFSVEAVKLLNPLVPAWKVASGEITNHLLLEAICETGKPVLLSTGMGTRGEVEAAVTWFGKYALMQCTSEYPTPAERVGLGELARLRWRHECPVGLSDHSGTPWPSIAAAALGASVIEVHAKLSPYDQGFDAAASIAISELARLVEGVRFVERALTQIDKDEMARNLQPMRDLFMGKAKRKGAYDASAAAAL